MCLAPWCRCCWRSRKPADRAHRVRIALAPAVPAHFHHAFTERFGFGLLDGYGSTETNCVMGAPLASSGRAPWAGSFRGFSARVVDDQDNVLPDGEAGELVLRADEPFAFATGYFGMADKTVEAWRISGSIPATASSASPTGFTASSTA